MKSLIEEGCGFYLVRDLRDCMFLSFQSNNCSLAKLSPSELVQHHEEAEVCIKSLYDCVVYRGGMLPYCMKFL